MSEEIATLGGGCFWCLDAVFREMEGVLASRAGYCGGTLDHPSYEQVCSGTTGHAEVVEIAFDTTMIDYRSLLDVFFAIHDPTTPDRQGHDIGTQYRSVIFAHSEIQAGLARRRIAELDAARLWPAPIVTAVLPAPTFWPAEDYHQNYFARHPLQGYCQAIIAPKLAHFRQQFADRLKRL